MAVFLPQAVEGACYSSTQLGLMERELEVQIKESFKESQAMREAFQNELGSARKDAERRLAEHNRHAKKEKGLQRDTDNARHRLLTVQGSLAESVEENARLKRELEAERIKTAAGCRRLEDAVERQDAALAEIRRDSGHLRDQRDRLAQDCAVMSIKLHQLKRKEAVGSIIHVLCRAQYASLARALRAWVVGATNDIHSKKRARRQEEHSSEIKTLEADLVETEIRCRNERRRNEALQNSREQVAAFAVMATRRRGGVARAAQDRGSPALQWCFWGWARVARGGNAAKASKDRRVELEKELARAKERAQCAETELVQHRAKAEKLNDEIDEGKQELESTRAALDAARSLASAAKDRTICIGIGRVDAILGHDRRNKVALAFARWADARRTFAPSLENYASPRPHSARRIPSTRTIQPKVETGEARSSPVVPPRWNWSVVPASINNDLSAPPAVAQMHEAVPASSNDDVSAPPALSEMQGVISPYVDKERSVETSDARQCDIKVPPPAPSIQEVALIDEQETNTHIGTQTRASSRRSSSRSGLCTALSSGDVVAESTTREETVGIQTNTSDIFKRVNSVGTRCHEDLPLSTKVSGDSDPADSDDFCSSSSSNTVFVCSSDVLDLPRLMLHLRAAVGEELYAVGERLLRCVEADHREIHGRPYCPVRLTGAERDQFRACFEDSVQGPLRHAVVAFLQAQDSYRAMAVERDREKGQAERVRNGGGAGRGGGKRSGGGSGPGSMEASVVSRGTKNARLIGGKNIRERNCDISSLAIGPLSTPAEKARAARVLRDRLVGLLEDADEVWGTRRRPWRTLRAGMGARGPRIRTTAKPKRDGANHMGNETDRSSPSWRMCSLDSGAGPRTFWEAVAGPRFIEAGWKIDAKALERSLWNLAILVRNQDRGQKVALRRCERLRRVLDLRIYEVLLLHVRTRLLWDGIKDDCRTVVGGNDTKATIWTGLERRASN